MAESSRDAELRLRRSAQSLYRTHAAKDLLKDNSVDLKDIKSWISDFCTAVNADNDWSAHKDKVDTFFTDMKKLLTGPRGKKAFKAQEAAAGYSAWVAAHGRGRSASPNHASSSTAERALAHTPVRRRGRSPRVLAWQ
ncbi:hypothetical protein JCM10207_004151 [Rhodosporidiobolus poonsookiae]